jgi:ribose 5-phosphate isomerase B
VRVALGVDHAGFPLKEAVAKLLQDLGHEVVDFGCGGQSPCDYPDAAVPLARAVARGECDLGVLMCGTGTGMSIAANKVPGAYAALCHEAYSARMARTHNGANVLALGGRVIGPELALDVVQAFLSATPSDAERHERRRAKVRAAEQQARAAEAPDVTDGEARS